MRKHPEENLRAIIKSLEQFGQQKPIIVDKHNQVIAGNGTLEAMTRAGWTKVQIVRTQLDGAQAEAFAIADNKTTDMSHFDFQALAEVLKDLDGKHIDLDTTGFQSFEREPLMQTEWQAPVDDDEAAEESVASSKHSLSLTEDQAALVQQAIAHARETLAGEYDTESDGAALAAFCYAKLN